MRVRRFHGFSADGTHVRFLSFFFLFFFRPAAAFSRRLRFTFPPFAPGRGRVTGGRFISFAYIGSAAFETVGASSGVPGYNPVRNGTRSGRAGMAQGSVANGVATIPRTALDRSFIFTNSPVYRLPPPIR